MKNILLTGLSGSGKTTLGRLCAQGLGMDFIDMDDLIVERAGMVVKDIFALHGEERFREMESAVACELAERSGTVVATGGGVVTREENVRALRQSGAVIFLDRPPEQIIGDLKCGERPLLAEGAEKLYEMSRNRRPLYLGAADRVFRNTGTLEEAVHDLIALIRGIREYAVIGDPIAHSLSPDIHGAVFRELGISDAYTRDHVLRGEVADYVHRARLRGLMGFNATAPHKQDIIPLLDEVDGEAMLCGAVNTVVNRDGRLHGCNTDMEGLLLSIRDCGYEYRHSRIVILGAGGATAGILLKAIREGARQVTVAARRSQAVTELFDRVQDVNSVTALTGCDLTSRSLTEAASRCDILINTIPAATNGADDMPLEWLAALPVGALVCDLLYSPPRTRLLLEAERLGHPVLNGLGMLIYQAILADELYTGKTIDKPGMYRAVSEALTPHEEERNAV